MSQNNKKDISEKNMTKIFVAVFVGIIVVLLAVIIIMLAAKNAGGPDDSGDDGTPTGSGGSEVTDPPIGSVPLRNDIDIPELKIDSIEEQNNDVVIITTYCTLRYPSAYYELIKADAYYGDGTGCIIFSADVGGRYDTVYTLLFNSEDGIDLGTLKLEGADEPIRVSVFFYDAPESVTGDALTVFYAAQETFNDISNSLEENEGFTSFD